MLLCLSASQASNLAFTRSTSARASPLRSPRESASGMPLGLPTSPFELLQPWGAASCASRSGWKRSSLPPLPLRWRASYRRRDGLNDLPPAGVDLPAEGVDVDVDLLVERSMVLPDPRLYLGTEMTSLGAVGSLRSPPRARHVILSRARDFARLGLVSPMPSTRARPSGRAPSESRRRPSSSRNEKG